jgi:scyllo-inositol 2-dehydrogenase (NADP+)
VVQTINVGIIGFGLSGKVFHSSLIRFNKDYHIKKIFSSRKEEINRFLPGIEVVTEVDDIFEDKNIDLIVICGPNSTHFDHCKRALIKGKHVVVEKPFVTSSTDGKELILIANKKGKLLSVFHNRRWDSDFLTIVDLIKSERLGEIKQFESNFDRWRPHIRADRWKESPGNGTGILFDLGSHLIDQALCVFGRPDSILGDVVDQKGNQGVDDYFHLILKYNNMRVILHSTSFSRETPRFQVFGKKGTFIKYGFDPQESSLVKEEDPGSENFGEESSDSFGKLTLHYNESSVSETYPSLQGCYNSFYREIAKAIKSENLDLNPVSPESALNVIKLIEAIKISSQEKKWVDL